MAECCPYVGNASYPYDPVGIIDGGCVLYCNISMDASLSNHDFESLEEKFTSCVLTEGRSAGMVGCNEKSDAQTRVVSKALLVAAVLVAGLGLGGL